MVYKVRSLYVSVINSIFHVALLMILQAPIYLNLLNLKWLILY